MLFARKRSKSWNSRPSPRSRRTPWLFGTFGLCEIILLTRSRVTHLNNSPIKNMARVGRLGGHRLATESSARRFQNSTIRRFLTLQLIATTTSVDRTRNT